ncbi:MAG TPA: ABC transporter ATP-binding protein [Actinomycetota bacterium]|jgi:ABC-2 type transport system ATP-binding protein|nr:ABC transporter ATP-binding protein [Actinomycetota bacterium]
MAGEPAIRTRALTKKYGEFTAVNSLDLEVSHGEIFGLLGPNGAGKTTTILMLLGLSEPTEGEAEVVGLDPARFPLEVKRRVGYLPDNVGFYATLTGRENLRYTARLNGLEREEGEARIDALLQQAGLGGAADSRVDTYSRGMRQRLGIADTLIKDPDVVILDEPTVAIDPEGVAEVLALIRSLARDRGVTLLLASHLLHQVQSVCDRVGIFVAGRMVAQGPMNELADRLSEGPVTVEVAVEGEAADIERVLRSVPDVEHVERDERDPRLWLIRGERDVRDEVVRALVSEGLPLRQLRRSGDELDEIYRRYFQEGEGR